MANLASAKKRDRQNKRNHLRNRARKSMLKSETRKFLDAVNDGDLDRAAQLLPTVTRKIDQVAAKGTLHKNTANRRKSRLARQLAQARTSKSG